MAFADKLKSLREKKNLTQVDLAKELGVTQRTISYYETGKGIPNDPDMLNGLARIFDVSLDFLLLDNNESDSKLHRFVKKLLDDTTNNKLTWNQFDRAVYIDYDDDHDPFNAKCKDVFDIKNFSQYADCVINNEQSYFCIYKDGGYLIAKIINCSQNITYALFILYDGEFHFISDVEAITQIEDLYLKITNTQSDIGKFIDSYLDDNLEPPKIKKFNSPLANTEEEIPF